MDKETKELIERAEEVIRRLDRAFDLDRLEV